MIAYNRSADHDALLTQWWAALNASGDFATTFTRSLLPLGAFLAYWRRPDITLVFAFKPTGIWFAAWFEPMLDGAALGLYVAPAFRRTKAAYTLLHNVISASFAQWPILIAITKQQSVVYQLERLGFLSCGVAIPRLWDGDSIKAMYLLPEVYHERRQQKRRRESSDRQPARDVERNLEQRRELLDATLQPR